MKQTFHGFITGAAGYVYDFYRYLRHTSATGITSRAHRSYSAVKIYHGLEKSLSFRNRSNDSGWTNVDRLVRLLSSTEGKYPLVGIHEQAGIKVLSDFVKTAAPGSDRTKLATDFLKTHPNPKSDCPGGVKAIMQDQMDLGKLENPEVFFHSRHSVRDFSKRKVEQHVVDRALALAISTPSVCNRQAWHVYHLDKRDVIDAALSFQNGNKGFGESIQSLLIVTADLAAFDSGSERYQHWIDGGMFSMTLILALHSLGVSTCCLNWSKGPRDDIKVRRRLPIRDEHSIVMFIAMGYPNPELQVCYSPRVPSSDICTHIDSIE